MFRKKKYPLGKVIAAGILAGLAAFFVMFLTFDQIGNAGGTGILINSEVQSAKLLSVWTIMEPLPKVTTQPGLMILIFALLGIVHATLYKWLAPAWPKGVTARGWRFALLLWFFSYLFLEFFGPFNLFSEPLPLIAVQLSFWVVVSLVEGYVLAAILERK